jgi:AAA domain-containing protein/Toprim domain-containing protein
MSPRDGFHRVLAAADSHGVALRPQNDGSHRGRCPIHQGTSTNSLSVQHLEPKPGDRGGRARIRCFAGCDEKQILDLLGLDWPDIYDEPIPVGARGAIREHVYPSATNRLVGVVQRHPTRPDGTKPFLPLTPNGEGSWQQKSSEELKTTPYRLPELVAAIDRGDPVWVVEGERDADALAAHGVTATCNAGGAGKWADAHAHWLKGALVTVCRDRDPAGHKHAEKVIATLAGIAASVRLVEPVEGKDITEHITAGHALDAVTELPISNSAESADGEESLAERYQPIDWHELWNGSAAEPQWLVDGLLERGRLHAIWAPRKHKKSLVTLVIVASLVTGQPLLGRPNPHGRALRVLYIDIENARDDIRQRLTDAGYGPGDLANLIYLSFPSLPGLDSAVGGTHLLALVERHTPDLLVLDTTSRVVTGKENDADTFRALYRHALAPIKATGTAILRLDHAGKDVTLGQRGSSAKGDDLDTAWLIIMHGDNRLTLQLDFQRTNHHPERIELVQHRNPLRFTRIDGAADRPEVTAAIAQLDHLGVPMTAGRPAVTKILSAAGMRVRTSVLSEAIKIRKNCSQDQGTGDCGDDHSEIHYDCSQDPNSDTETADEGCSEQLGNSGNSGAELEGAPPVPELPVPVRGQVRDGRPDQPRTTTKQDHHEDHVGPAPDCCEGGPVKPSCKVCDKSPIYWRSAS